MLEKISLMLKMFSPNHDSTDEQWEKYKQLAGKTGELITMSYLDFWGTQYFHIEQNCGTKPQWLRQGKRPDFVAFTNDPAEMILIDAKFHTQNKGKFQIKIDELTEYNNLVQSLSTNGRNANLIFIIPVGGCNINYFYCYTLDDFLSGQISSDGIFRTVDVTGPLDACNLRGTS